MHSYDLSPSDLSLFILIITTLVFTNLQTSVLSQDDEQYRACENAQSFDCADKRDLRYPFWGNNKPEFCGHPMFELNCSGAAPEITVDSVTYRVLDVNPTTRILTLARADLWDNTCPEELRSTHFDTTYFESVSGTQTLTLHYRCPVSAITASIPSRFSCPGDGSDVNNIYIIDQSISNNIESCDASMTISISGSSVRSLETTTPNLTAAVVSGFEIEWKANDSACEECVRSDGVCGSNDETGVFTCYCEEGPSSSVCRSGSPDENRNGNNNQVPRSVGLSIAGACIFGIVIGGLTYYFIQRRKRRAALAKSKDISVAPSSKTDIVPSTNFFQSAPSGSSYTYSKSKSDIEKGSTYFGVQVFSYTELEEATENFKPSRELGEGGFGTVYYGQLRDGRAVAVKRLYENSFKRVEQFMNEVEILTRLQHQNLVKLYGCTSRRSRELLLVYEFIPNGTVADHLHGKQSGSGPLSWPVRLSIAIETADALAYLHRTDIIHRDVKTNNILLDGEFRVKVADFGLSKLFPTDVTHVSTAPQGTPGYVDPEYYQCYQLTAKSDVYSFGVVLIELISSLQAVDTNRHRLDINLANMAITKIQNHLVSELADPSLGFDRDENVKKMATDMAELAFRCLQQERDMRPSMEEVLSALRAIRDEDRAVDQIAEVVDIRSEDIGLLRNLPPPLSPDSAGTDKWSSNTPNSY